MPVNADADYMKDVTFAVNIDGFVKAKIRNIYGKTRRKNTNKYDFT